jgi:hypothetical protein
MTRHGSARQAVYERSAGALDVSRPFASEDQIYTAEDELEQATRNVAHSLGEKLAVDCDQLRHTGNGISRKPGRTGAEDDVAWSTGKTEVTRQGDNEHRGDLAAVKGVALHDQHGAAETGS